MPESPRPLGRRRALLLAAGIALLVTWMTGAIPRWGQWYSDQPYYRAQVHAFFEGRLALTTHVEGVTHDLAWIDGGVQHVWGLGVPLWLTPFEAIGRVVHLSPFPERIAMLVGMILALYVLARAWFGPGGDRSYGSIGAFLFTALLPGVLAMLRGRIAVYEEASAYAYGASMLLMGGVMMMIRRPSTARYVLLLAFAGATGLLRPTVWFYGASAAGISTILYVRYRGGVARSLKIIALASALFLAGGAALYATNYLRFGRGTEFGHRLNLEDLPGNLYATRFEYPFESVPTGEAATELVGGMFGHPEAKMRAGGFFYERKLHVGELEVARWREYYFQTYTWAWIPWILAGLGVCAWSWLRARSPVPRVREARWLGLWAIFGGAPLLVFYLRSPSVSSRYFLDVGPTFAVLLALAWRALSARLGTGRVGRLAAYGFFAWWAASAFGYTVRRSWAQPARATAAKSAMLALTDPLPGAQPLPDAYDLDDPWLERYIGGDQWTCPCYVDSFREDACDHEFFARDTDVRQTSGDRKDRVIERRIDRDVEPVSRSGGAWPVACSVEDPDPQPPDALPEPPAAMIVEQDAPVALYRNGTNWDLTTGAVAVATYFFADAPEYVEVEISPIDGTVPTPDFVAQVRAKVMLEELPLASSESTARGVRLRFAGPRTAKYREGLQVIFLAFGAPDALDQPVSHYKLWRVAWRDR